MFWSPQWSPGAKNLFERTSNSILVLHRSDLDETQWALRNLASKIGPRRQNPSLKTQWQTYKGNGLGFGGSERILLYLRAQMESGKVFGHKVIQKVSGNNFKTHFQALGALSRHLRPDRDSNPTDFPILDRYYFGQVLTTIGDTVVQQWKLLGKPWNHDKISFWRENLKLH